MDGGRCHLSGKERPTVALPGPNSVDMLVCLMAVHAGGAVIVPLNGRNAGPKLDARIARTRPDIVAVHPSDAPCASGRVPMRASCPAGFSR
ncbi:AMP-binding protein [Pseudooceanicola sp. 216_PA32_1]|uniref:AMP-binding protein n=1 Tax=Pseudooceanicola pacificus TaxID=2676438 RepID=A0A844W2S6_9RHOB|nr:hypothetical protein [Pseudooceanicola pacificus]MWB78087.1 AMP-binding protein [Pseudooceanicola pacificus]